MQAGPIAERSKSSDLDCGWGGPGSKPSEGIYRQSPVKSPDIKTA